MKRLAPHLRLPLRHLAPALLLGIAMPLAQVGYAPLTAQAAGQTPAAFAFQPRDNAVLAASPTTLSAAASPGSRLTLDGRIIGGSYAHGQLVYHPPKALAPGLHLLGLIGPDGAPAGAHAQFLVAPPGPEPAGSAAGSYEGLAWVRTTTPDGRYTLFKPASWKMADSNGRILLADPKGGSFILIGERFITNAVDAQDLAHQLSAAFGKGKLRITTPFQFAGTADRTLFAGVIAAGKQSLLSVNLVLSEPSRYTLGIALGLSTSATASAGKILARIEASLAANDEAAVPATQRWQQYNAGALTLEYPAGWLANFTGTGPTWFINPNTGGMIFAIGQGFDGTVSQDGLTRVGRLVTQNIASRVHKGLKVVSEAVSGGVYRWLGVYPGPDGTSQDVEFGQVAAGNGRVSVVWGDSNTDGLPVNLPLFGRTLDSMARNAGAAPPRPATVAGLLDAVHQYSGDTSSADTGDTGDGTGTGDTGAANPDPQTSDLLSAQSSMYRSQEAYATLSNLEMERHEAFMSMMGYTYEYVPISW